jgi:Mce-associated membrane protein
VTDVADPETEAAAPETAAPETDATDPDQDGAEQSVAAPAARPLGRWFAVLVAVAALLFVGSATFAGAAVKPYLSDRATAETKLRVARTAAQVVSTLFNYTPDNMDTLADRASAYLSGDYQVEYRRLVTQIVPVYKQKKITNSAEVNAVAVEELHVPNAVALVYASTTSTTPLSKNIPSLKSYSYRISLKRVEGRWLVTGLNTITSSDVAGQA